MDSGIRGRMVRHGEQGPPRRGQPRIRDTARDNVPRRGIQKNPKRNIAQFLDADELARLGCVLGAREAEWPQAAVAI